MEQSEFVHLHLHSQYSLLDGAIRFEELFELAKKQRMSAVALTDHGNMFGAIEFYEKAIKHGIKPILGCEVYVAHGSRFERKTNGNQGPYHLTLLVKNRNGYFNLMKLVSLAYLEGFYYKPRIDLELLSQLHEGLIGLSGCVKGEVAIHASTGDMKKALETARRYAQIFGDGGFFIEVQRNGVDQQEILNERLVEIARQCSLPIVATNDCHYLRREDVRAHEVLLCIQTGKSLQDGDRMRFPSDQFYFKSAEEMKALFADLPEAIFSTREIAEQCNLELRFDERHIPRISLPPGESLNSTFEKLAREGLEKRLAGLSGRPDFRERAEKYWSRLEEEMDVIKSMGYSGYFLIVADFIRYAKSRGIPVGPGRGSAAGSLVAYSLGITDLDPIEYDLLFERFLNPGRKSSMPDVDVDFCMEGRDEVIRYVMEKYGKDKVAQIITFGKMQARAVIRDVGRAMDIPYAEVDAIAKLIPASLNITLDQALEQEPRLREAVQRDPKIDAMFNIAKALEGLARHASTHAAGIVIANRPLMEYLPLYKSQDGEVMTQYSMRDVEKIGLVKFDFLGLKTLTVVDLTLKLVEKETGVHLDLSKIPLDDPETFALLSSGSTLGIFQLEGSGMRDLLLKLKPSHFKEIIALVALYRPGPLGSGMVEEFIKRKHGEQVIHYEVKELEDILGDTYGVIVYQEQVMRIASRLAHFSLEDADILRRAMAKKDPKEMEKQKEKFLEGTKKSRIPPKKAERIFDLIAKFAEYGFNKSHSAAYALIAYQTAYLKAHYPVEFMAASLSCEVQNPDKMVKYIAECREMGIDILPPHINESDRRFSVLGKKIRFGLAGVKNVGDAAIEVILAERQKGGPFKSLHDFCRRVDLRRVNRRVIESLIKSGAFDFTGAYRSQMLAGLEQIMEDCQRLQRMKEAPQLSIWGVPESRTEEGYPQMEEFPEKQLLAFEKETIGFYVSRHPLASYKNAIRKHASDDTSTISERKNGEEVRLCGLMSELREKVTRKGDRMAFLTLEDMNGFVEVILFPEVYKAALPLLRGEDPVLVRGILDSTDEHPKIKAIEVKPLPHENLDSTKELHVKVPVSSLGSIELQQLKSLIVENRGDTRVLLHLIDGDKGETVIALPDKYRVDPSLPFREGLKSLLVSSVVSLE